MFDREVLEELGPLALAWAKAQEAMILACGSPLTPAAMEDAVRVGVKEPARVRVLLVERISLPEDPRLADASRRAYIITDASTAVTIGHGIMVRLATWGDRELLVHQLVHVAQCERCGGLERYVNDYLNDRQTGPEFTSGEFEDEARRVAREICAESR